MVKKLTTQLKQGETLLEYKHRVIDDISSSFCAAKWYNATIWLGSGQTTSCHHPLAHSIPLEQVNDNPKVIHNTEKKKYERQQMLSGERPDGCQYCWKIEDSSPTAVSDRVFKTVIYTDEEIQAIKNMRNDADVDLKTLEISFDRTCNFACSYCNPSFSSTWVNDIRKNGEYLLNSAHDSTYKHTHGNSQLYKHGEENPYVTAFFKWWESDLQYTLKQLRITGGEPLMSGDTWKLLDWFSETGTDMELAINSNLGAKDEIIDRLIDTSKKIKNFSILYTSNEAVGKQAEYIRDGLDYAKWQRNVVRVLEECDVETVHVMCTINALCLESLTEFFDWCLSLKPKYLKNDDKTETRLTFNLNILRFPNFQNVLVLPDDLRRYFKVKLETWLMLNDEAPYFTEFEKESVSRLIEYLDKVDSPTYESEDVTVLRQDFYNFYSQYDVRRGFNLVETFPIIGQWFQTLKPTEPTVVPRTT